MLNQVVLVGRITREPEVKELDDGKKVSNITLAVSRSYKNEEGIYETDFIDCTLWNSIATNMFEYCKKGDVVGVRGSLRTDNYEKDGKLMSKLNLIAERITFLSSKERSEKVQTAEAR